jgi:peroxiredoxin
VRVRRIVVLVMLVAGLSLAGCASTPDSAPAPSPEPEPELPAEPSPAPAPEPDEGFNVGDRAIDFQLERLDGETVALRDLRGGPVVLNFWATWCGPCRFEMPFLQGVFEDRAGADGLVIMAVNVGEGPSQVAAFMEENDLSFPVLLDKDTVVAQNYNIIGIPTTLFIDKNGIIGGVQVGAFMSEEELYEWLDNLMLDGKQEG